MPISKGVDRSELQLHGWEKVGWKALYAELEKEGFRVADVPWDWRMSIDPNSASNAIDTYLIPAIEDLKAAAGGVDKVNIAAHSLGGLLVRAYIQSNKYKNDIEKFVMMGTPNRGGSLIYYIWEGGDIIDSGFLIRTGSIANLKDAQGGTSWSRMTRKERVEFIQKEVPSALEVMPPPDEKYLRKFDGSPEGGPAQATKNQ